MSEPLPHLDTFSLAAETGSFTAAARQMDVTQAAVSQRIAALEKELKVSLFERCHGRVELTPAGRRLHEIAQQVQALHERARQELSGDDSEVRGEVCIAASTIPGEHLLPEALARFQARYPHVRVRAHVRDSEAVFALVEQGEAHLGLAGQPCDSPHIEQRCFAKDEMVLVVPPTHPWAKQKQLALEKLTTQPVLLREPGSGSRRCLEQALARAGMSLERLRVSAELGSNEAIREAVLRGAGVAFLSRFAVSTDADAGRLAVLRVAGLALDRGLYVLYDRRRAVPTPARLFMEVLTGE
jgi:DNA-binding transcriptional LysR family regulator